MGRSDAVLRILSEYDPFGLEPGRVAPEDEYRLEADEIATILRSSRRITIEEFRAVGLKWFSDPDWFGVDTEDAVAAINALV
ncbi:hypothetical protein [Cryobacterium sp. BB736]|uniref:hypothetical protein n=1 Tax=Cryobacterium sp. BB736 TaxID=2746963 RepID=UPI001876A919|nr:hypothetical protein [Cryobacterium sp. BB736]